MKRYFKELLLFFGLIVFVGIVFLPGFSKLQELKDTRRDLEEKIKHLALENSILERELERLKKEEFVQEKILREKLGLVRKGEIPVKIIPEE